MTASCYAEVLRQTAAKPAVPQNLAEAIVDAGDPREVFKKGLPGGGLVRLDGLIGDEQTVSALENCVRLLIERFV